MAGVAIRLNSKRFGGELIGMELVCGIMFLLFVFGIAFGGDDYYDGY